jgi:hypothetical protein
MSGQRVSVTYHEGAPVQLTEREAEVMKANPNLAVGLVTPNGLETKTWNELGGNVVIASRATPAARPEELLESVIDFTPAERERLRQLPTQVPSAPRPIVASRAPSDDVASGDWRQNFETPLERQAREAAVTDAENARALAADDAAHFGDDLPPSVLHITPQTRKTILKRRGL